MTTDTKGQALESADPKAAMEYAGLRSARSGSWGMRGRRKLFWLVCVMVTLVPIQAILCRLPLGYWWPGASLFHRMVATSIGIRVRMSGERVRGKPVLYVVNHISWIDILILGALLPRSQFIAKSDITGWGFVGWLATLQRSVFINREKRQESAKQLQQMLQPFKRGNSLVLFPEGTTSLGQKILPFRSSLFAVVAAARRSENIDIAVQPVTLSYTAVDGIPLTRSRRAQVAWIGDMELVDHARGLFAKGRVQAHLHFHPPADEEILANRKQVSAYCEAQIANGLAQLHRRQQPE